MSISSRRNSLRKSSISINSIRNTFTSFSKGITNAKQSSDDIIKGIIYKKILKIKIVIKNMIIYVKKIKKN